MLRIPASSPEESMVAKHVVLVMAIGARVNGSFSLAKRLSAEGYTLTYLEYIPGFQVHIERQGLKVQPLVPRDAPGGARHGKGKRAQYRQQLVAQVAQREYLNAQVDAWIIREKPSLALIDADLLDAIPPFMKHRVPIMLLDGFPSSYLDGSRPPRCAASVLSRVGRAARRVNRASRWLKAALRQHINELTQSLELSRLYTRPTVPSLTQQIVSLGGRLDRHAGGVRFRAPRIVLGPAAFDWPMAPIAGRQYYAGLCVDKERNDGCELRVCERRENVIYLSMGTYSKHYPYVERLYRCTYESMAFLPDHHLIMQVPNQGEMRTHIGIAPNITYVERAPQLEVLQRAGLFISQGGYSSVREAIMYETPLIVFPGWLDQAWNASRVEHLGIGLKGDVRNVTTETLLFMIRHAADNNTMKAALRQLHRTIADADELSTTVGTIKHILEATDSWDYRAI